MKTLVVIEVEHKHPLPQLAEMIAQRAYSMDGVDNAVVREGAGLAVVSALKARRSFRGAKANIMALLDRVEEDLK